MKQLFILAQKRTGSTLLQRILNQIPGFAIAGENGGAFLHLAKFHKLILNIPSKKNVLQKYVEGESEIKPAWLNPWVDDVPRIQRYLRAMMTQMYDVQGCRVWGFKEIRYGRFGETYEEFLNQVSFFRDLFPDCRLLFLTRSLDALIESNLKHPPRGLDLTDETLARFVKLQLSHFEAYEKAYADHAFLLSFEDIIQRTPRFCEALFEFLNVPFQKDYLAPLKKDL